MPYMIQGRPANISTEPFLHNSKHYVPMREIVEELSGSVTFDNDAKMAVATIGQWAARVQNGDTNVDVSGTPVTLSAPPFVEDDVFFVPFDFFKTAYGYNVTLDGDTMNIVNPNA